jgi:hypothetical protein
MTFPESSTPKNLVGDFIKAGETMTAWLLGDGTMPLVPSDKHGTVTLMRFQHRGNLARDRSEGSTEFNLRAGGMNGVCLLHGHVESAVS